jgi:hypothetical protein
MILPTDTTFAGVAMIRAYTSITQLSELQSCHAGTHFLPSFTFQCDNHALLSA